MSEKQKFCTLSMVDGVNFNYYIDERFKRNRISINLILPLDKDTVAKNALVINILKNGYNDCPEYSEIFKKLEMLYGASLSCGVEKRADYQVLHLSVSGIDNRFSLDNEDIIKELSLLLTDILLNPLMENGGFREKYIELEKTQLIDLIESEINEKRLYALNAAVKIMNGDSVGGTPKYGTKEDVKNATNEELVVAYKNIIKNSRVEIMFVGCGDYNISYNLFKTAFSAIKKENTITIDVNPIRITDGIKEKTEIMAVNQAKMVMGFTTGKKYDDSLMYALRVMVAIFGGTPFAKLFVNVREKLSLCYYCAARFDKFKGIMLVDSGVEFDNISKAYDEILNQLEQVKAGDFTDIDINNAILSIKNSLNSVNDDTGSIESYYFSELFSSTITSPQQEIELFSMVTKNDIIEAAKTLNLDTVYILKGGENTDND